MGKKQGQRLESLEKIYKRLTNDLPKLSESAFKLDRPSQVKLWDKSKCKKALSKLQHLLLDDSDICLERALDIGVFDTVTSYAQLDRPAGVLASVLHLYTQLIAGIQRVTLLTNMAFQRSVTSLLLDIAENLKKGVEFYEVDKETINFLYVICLNVQKTSSLLEILLVKDNYQAYEYLPIPILLYYFKQKKYEADQRLREVLLMTVQIENRDVLLRLLSCTDFTSSLISKLDWYFRALPDRLTFSGLTPVKCPDYHLSVFQTYCQFLNEVCEKCIWQDLLSPFGVLLNYNFFDRVVTPLLTNATTYPTTMYVSRT